MSQTEEAKRKQEELENQKKLKEQELKNQKEMPKKVTALEAQVADLQERLQVATNVEVNRKQEETKKLALEEFNKLESDADLNKALRDALKDSPKEDATSVEDLTNKQLLEVIADCVEKSTSANTKLILSQIGTKIGETEEKISGTRDAVIKLIAGLGVKEVQDKYKDFGTYQEEVRQIMSTTQGLSPEQAYLLVKAQKKESTVSQKDVETEKPDTSLTRSSNADRAMAGMGSEGNKEPEPRRGTAGFRADLMEGIDRVLARKKS